MKERIIEEFDSKFNPFTSRAKRESILLRIFVFASVSFILSVIIYNFPLKTNMDLLLYIIGLTLVALAVSAAMGFIERTSGLDMLRRRATYMPNKVAEIYDNLNAIQAKYPGEDIMHDNIKLLYVLSDGVYKYYVKSKAEDVFFIEDLMFNVVQYLYPIPGGVCPIGYIETVFSTYNDLTEGYVKLIVNNIKNEFFTQKTYNRNSVENALAYAISEVAYLNTQKGMDEDFDRAELDELKELV